MREPPRLSLKGTCFLVLIRMELARLRDQIIPQWMYPSRADVGSEAIVNQKQHQLVGVSPNSQSILIEFGFVS